MSLLYTPLKLIIILLLQFQEKPSIAHRIYMRICYSCLQSDLYNCCLFNNWMFWCSLTSRAQCNISDNSNCLLPAFEEHHFWPPRMKLLLPRLITIAVVAIKQTILSLYIFVTKFLKNLTLLFFNFCHFTNTTNLI